MKHARSSPCIVDCSSPALQSKSNFPIASLLPDLPWPIALAAPSDRFPAAKQRNFLRCVCFWLADVVRAETDSSPLTWEKVLLRLQAVMQAYAEDSGSTRGVKKAKDHTMLFEVDCLTGSTDKPLEKMRVANASEQLQWPPNNHARRGLLARIKTAVHTFRTLLHEWPDHPCVAFSALVQARSDASGERLCEARSSSPACRLLQAGTHCDMRGPHTPMRRRGRRKRCRAAPAGTQAKRARPESWAAPRVSPIPRERTPEFGRALPMVW